MDDLQVMRAHTFEGRMGPDHQHALYPTNEFHTALSVLSLVLPNPFSLFLARDVVH